MKKDSQQQKTKQTNRDTSLRHKRGTRIQQQQRKTTITKQDNNKEVEKNEIRQKTTDIQAKYTRDKTSHKQYNEQQQQ